MKATCNNCIHFLPIEDLVVGECTFPTESPSYINKDKLTIKGKKHYVIKMRSAMDTCSNHEKESRGNVR